MVRLDIKALYQEGGQALEQDPQESGYDTELLGFTKCPENVVRCKV